MPDTEFNELIHGIYDAVIEPERWHDALQAIRRRYRFEIAMLGVFNVPAARPVVLVSSNVPEHYQQAVARLSGSLPELWGGLEAIRRMPLEEPILHSRVPAFETRFSNPYYLEWAKPQGLVDQVVIFLANDWSTNASLGLGIHYTRGPVTEVEFEELRLLAPHLRRAALISRLLDLATDTANVFSAAFDAMSSGAVLVDAGLGIVHANRAAEAMLLARDPIRSVGGRLELCHEAVPGRLEAAVMAATDEVGLGGRGIGIPALRADGSGVAVHVMPLARSRHRGAMYSPAVAAVFVAEAGAASPVAAVVGQLYGLTPAELRVFELVAGGRSSRDMAAELGIAESTVRTHLLRVFDKTGRHSRIDLVRLAHEVGVPA